MKLQDHERIRIHKFLYDYINDICIERIKTKTIEEYRCQFLLRRGFFNLQFLTYIGYLFWDKFADEYKKTPFQIAGVETASTPLLIGILMTAPTFECDDINCFSIRREKSPNQFEGLVKPNLPVFIVDDICNSQKTIVLAARYLKEARLDVFYKAFAVVYKDERSKINTKEDNQIEIKMNPKYEDKNYVTLYDTIEHLFKFREFILEYDAYNMSKKFNIG